MKVTIEGTDIVICQVPIQVPTSHDVKYHGRIGATLESDKIMFGFIATNKKAEDFLWKYNAKMSNSAILRTAFGLTYYATKEEMLPELKKSELSYENACI